MPPGRIFPVPFPHLRRSFAVGAAAAAIAVAIAALGLTNGATVGHDKSSSGALSARVFGSRAKLDAILSNATGTYIDRLLADRDSTLERWADHVAIPLRVWVDSNAAVDGDQALFPAAVRSAFADWAATGIPIHITYVDSARDADLRVRWADYLDNKTGSTTWRTNRSGVLTHGDITLATHTGDGRTLDGHGMKAIALHEVGHALGLSHSLDAHDIMASLVQTDSLSPPDRETIRLLYSLPPGHVH
jgi:predicted Zn-dependent protease